MLQEPAGATACRNAYPIHPAPPLFGTTLVHRVWGQLVIIDEDASVICDKSHLTLIITNSPLILLLLLPLVHINISEIFWTDTRLYEPASSVLAAVTQFLSIIGWWNQGG